MRVLIVDDNEELRDFLALCLIEAAIDAVAARDPADALLKIATGEFDVLVIDSIMEHSDGIELVEQIRASKSGRKIPILMMSTISTALARRMATGAGCNEFLVKPFGQAQFIEQIKNLGQ